MRAHFPRYESVEMEWTNIDERTGPNRELLAKLLDEHIQAPEVIIEAHRGLGALLPRDEVVAFICSHYGPGTGFRVADRAFTTFLVVTSSGVVAGWRKAGQP